MDIVKVHYDEELQGVYGDDCRYLFDVSEKKLCEEVVKRINMHDELVSMLKDIALVDGGSECIKSKIARARELLERCK